MHFKKKKKTMNNGFNFIQLLLIIIIFNFRIRIWMLQYWTLYKYIHSFHWFDYVIYLYIHKDVLKLYILHLEFQLKSLSIVITYKYDIKCL